MSSPALSKMVGLASTAAFFLLVGALFAFAAWKAYTIRLYAIETYGRVIHEFDPWFNMRAAQYLADHGYKAFFKVRAARRVVLSARGRRAHARTPARSPPSRSGLITSRGILWAGPWARRSTRACR